MKKNYVMRFAAVLLVLVLLSTCVVSGTFAKYVTKDDATDTARVAKWGVTVAVEASEAAVLDTNGGAAETEIITNTGELLAPGTKGTFATVTVDGEPEVAVSVTHVATVTLTGWEVDSAYYCPVVVKVNGTPVAAGSDAADFAAKIKAAIEAFNDAEVTTEEELEQSITVTWEWAFETGETPEEKEENNEKDTALGDLATAPSITVAITTTVTQID